VRLISQVEGHSPKNLICLDTCYDRFLVLLLNSSVVPLPGALHKTRVCSLQYSRTVILPCHVSDTHKRADIVVDAEVKLVYQVDPSRDQQRYRVRPFLYKLRGRLEPHSTI
jgi:hypothetical protein